MDEVKKQIIDLIEKFAKFKPECINDSIQLSKDLGFDSIRLLSFVVEIEDLFSIQIDEEFLGVIFTATIKQLVDYVEGLLNRK